MPEELSNDAELVCLVTMDGFVVFDKQFLEQLLPKSIELAETFSNIAVEFVEGLLLIRTLDNH